MKNPICGVEGAALFLSTRAGVLRLRCVVCNRTGSIQNMYYGEAQGVLIALEHLSPQDVEEVDYIFPKNDEGYNEWKVRSGPSPNFPKVASIAIGERVVVTHVEEPWMRVRLETGLSGWTRRADMHGVTMLHRATDQTHRIGVRVYTGWRRGSPASPAPFQIVRQIERIGSGEAEDSVAYTTFISEARPDAVSCVSLPHEDTAVKSVDVCPVTGNIAVGSDSCVVVHAVKIGSDGIPLVTKL